MNSKTWWVVGVIAVLVVGGFLYWGMNGKGGAGKETTDTNGQASGTSLKSLLSSGKSEKCTFSDDNNLQKSNGVVYISGGKMRGDFQVFPKVSTQSIVASHMILMDNVSYVWTDTSSQGFKVGFAAQAGSSSSAPQQAVNLDQQMNYDCTAWTPDPKLFTLPTSVTFSDMTSVTGGTGAAGGVVKPGGAMLTQQCQACMDIPDATARKQCQTALHCPVTPTGTPQNY